MTNEKFNGWTNYETWNVALWFDNEQSSQEYWKERAQEHYNDAVAGEYEGQTREFEAAYSLSKEMKEQAEEFMPEVEGFYADLLQAALQEVNWMEIAQHYMEYAVEVEKHNQLMEKQRREDEI